MSYADRVHRWNTWYDSLPDRWRFQVVLWPLLLIAAINMLLTIASGFPFALLLILAILGFAALRVPYKAGWVTPREATESAPAESTHTVNLGRVDWAYDLNLRYDEMPEWRRFWVFPAILIVVGLINMWLTVAAGFPFALLFLLALLAIIAVRAPYAWGWITPPPGRAPAAPATITGPASNLHIAHQPAAPLVAPVAAPVTAPEPVPAAAPVTIDHAPHSEPDSKPADA